MGFAFFNGNGSFVVPGFAAGNRFAFEVKGNGGHGAGSTSGATAGGGAGATVGGVQVWTPGETVDVTLFAGGAASKSSLKRDGGATVVCEADYGRTPATNSTTGGVGGLASNCTVPAGGWAFNGGTGGDAGSNGGGGGEVGKAFRAGANASGQTGGSTPTERTIRCPYVSGSGGRGGNGGSPGVQGENGEFPGGGGGGANNQTDGSGTGANAGAWIWWSGVGIDDQGGVTWTGPGCVSMQSSYSWSHTVGTSTNRYLLVGVALATTGRSATGVTAGGQAMTFLGAVTQASVRSELWGLVAPPTGSITIQVTLDGASDAEGTSMSFSWIDQLTPTEGFTSAGGTNGGSPADASLNVTIKTSKSVVVDYLTSTDGTITAGTGQTSVTTNSCVAGNGMSYKGPENPGTTNVYWTDIAASQSWAYVAVALRPSWEWDGTNSPVPTSGGRDRRTHLPRPVFQR